MFMNYIFLCVNGCAHKNCITFEGQIFQTQRLYGTLPSKTVDGPVNHKSLSTRLENRKPLERISAGLSFDSTWYQQPTSTNFCTSSTVLLTKTSCFLPSPLNECKTIMESHGRVTREGERGRSLLHFFKIQRKVPWFWKKLP